MNARPSPSGSRRPPPGSGLAVRSALLVLLVVWVGWSGPTPAGASVRQEDDNPALTQTIPREQPVVTGPAELASGHVDLGPRFVDGDWRLLVHDTVTRPPVWRPSDDVVLRVGDAGRVPVPEDPRYGFVGARPGEPVWVIPQTENPGVVWLGWNTQDPEVMERIDRGVRLRLIGADGPGDVSVYLQSGDLSGPEVLWRSGAEEADPLWVDVNTHTHANWVFSAPGPYVLRIEAVAELLDGTEVRDTADVRLAVGDATPTAAAATLAFSGVEAPPLPAREGRDGRTGSGAAAGSGDGDTGRAGGSAVLPVVALVAAAALLGAVGLGAARTAADRRRAVRGRSGPQL